MHRVTEERTHRECGWKHGGGHGVIALDGKEPPRRLDKQCLLMEVRIRRILGSPRNNGCLEDRSFACCALGCLATKLMYVGCWRLGGAAIKANPLRSGDAKP
jgi:hypothetical protein